MTTHIVSNTTTRLIHLQTILIQKVILAKCGLGCGLTELEPVADGLFLITSHSTFS
jgi:hypothetical protein